MALQITLVGALFTSLAICSDSIYALATGRLGNWLKRNYHFWKGQKFFTGSVYIFLG